MNPLEAMARAIFSVRHPGCNWDSQFRKLKNAFLTEARAAKNALADNVDEKMRGGFNQAFIDAKKLPDCIAAAIRAAGEE